MIVKNKKRVNMWIFIKPLRWDLWLTILAACIFIGVTLRFLEHRPGKNNIISESERQDDSLGLHLWFPITTLAFPERNMVVNNWSRFVLVVWLFMAFILMQSYTAKLSSIFTVDQLRFDQNYNVGYQAGSFVKDLMIDTLRFPVTKLKPYSSIEEYHDAMTLGSKHGGVDAIFDELPYLKVFLRKYFNQYKMIGQTYKTQGFGLAFPIGSPLVRHFSRTIRSVCDIVINDDGPAGYPYVYDDSSGISQDNPSLTAYDFGGLFIIVGSATLLAVFCSECPLGKLSAGNLLIVQTDGSHFHLWRGEQQDGYIPSKDWTKERRMSLQLHRIITKAVQRSSWRRSLEMTAAKTENNIQMEKSTKSRETNTGLPFMEVC